MRCRLLPWAGVAVLFAVSSCGGQVMSSDSQADAGCQGANCSVPEKCCDGVDNDLDGLTDGADPDCLGPCACGGCVEVCNDVIDNDHDGFVDCRDPDCEGNAVCELPEDCCDGKDNDFDGRVDMSDPDCSGSCECSVCSEICNNGADENHNGLVDCEDPDCKGNSACPLENCCDGKDNDGDGKVDMSDPDCQWVCACGTCVETCDDGKDNDGNGAIDCNDENCVGSKYCIEEICDGVDNNQNGQTDEGNVCSGVEKDCPPGAIQICDCYGGVHRRCKNDGTWGPCLVDYLQDEQGNQDTCVPAQVTSQQQCTPPAVCDSGKCIDYTGTPWQQGTQCVHQEDCSNKKMICDLGYCKIDPYVPQCQ